MIDYLADIKPLEDAGMTDADIASHLASRTSTPIPCGDAKVVLEESGLVVEDPVTGVRSGTLIDRYGVMPAGPLKVLLGWFIAHVFGRGEQISSNDNPRAVQLASVLADLPGGFQSVAQKLLALGGGQPHAGTLEADVIAARDAHTAQLATSEAERIAEEARAALHADHASKMNEHVSPRFAEPSVSKADLIAAHRALADAWENE